MTDAAEEQAVGILCFVNSCSGFKAILKHRYADFKVNEVNLQGQVVRLTTLECPQEAQGSAAVAEAGAETGSLHPEEAVEALVQRYAQVSGASGSHLEALRGFLTQAQLHDAACNQADSAKVRAPEPLVLLPPISDKEVRAAVHRLFKSLPGFPRLETNTVDPAAEQGEGSRQAGCPDSEAAPVSAKLQCIQLAVANKDGSSIRAAGRGQKRKWRDGSQWAGGNQRYIKFVLFKENMDTQQAISVLAKMLRVSHKLFAVAGTKDKRGVTVQEVTAFKLDPGRLAALNSRLRGMRVGNFEFAQNQLRLGDLQGNRFELVLRAIEADSSEAVAAAAEGLRQSGFINYYGLQRFGTGAVPTHRIGQALLCGQWRQAVRLLLTPRDDCPRSEQVQACRLYLDQGDVAAALRLMPRFLIVEPIILQGLKQHGPTGYLNALMAIPRNLRTMYIHAYQSYLWNAAATHRIQTYGARSAVEGDIVMARGARQQTAARKLAEQQPTAPVGAGTASTSDAASAGADIAAIAGEGGEVGPEEADAVEEGLGCGDVHVVTAADVASGAWSIEDVVLPLPGTRVRFPQHTTAQVYRDLAAQDGVSLDFSAHSSQEFSISTLTGAYRYLLHRPTDLEYELIRYSDPDADLAGTDLMELQGQTLPPTGHEAGGRYLALRLAFTLPASCYATMLIRELTKQSTSVAHHKNLGHEPAAGQVAPVSNAT